jgi:hypothetical protein
MSKSAQNSSVRACIPSVPCGEKMMNQEEIDKLPGVVNLEANSTKRFEPPVLAFKARKDGFTQWLGFAKVFPFLKQNQHVFRFY